MKKIMYLFSLLTLTSCAVAFQQIASISSPQMQLADDGHFAYSENDIVVDYNFWAPSGKMSFVITNNLESDVYVDLGRSFLVVNGMTFDYFQNRTYSSNSSETSLSGRGVEYKEKEGVWIPAHSSRRFCEFTLMDAPYRQCGFARNPSKDEDMTLSFTEKDRKSVV